MKIKRSIPWIPSIISILLTIFSLITIFFYKYQIILFSSLVLTFALAQIFLIILYIFKIIKGKDKIKFSVLLLMLPSAYILFFIITIILFYLDISVTRNISLYFSLFSNLISIVYLGLIFKTNRKITYEEK